jgi:hypothetical protein
MDITFTLTDTRSTTCRVDVELGFWVILEEEKKMIPARISRHNIQPIRVSVIRWFIGRGREMKASSVVPSSITYHPIYSIICGLMVSAVRGTIWHNNSKSDPSFYISIINPRRCSNFWNLFYFGDNPLHVSDGLSIHHKEFKTVHTATGMCQSSISLLLVSREQYLLDIYLLLYVQSWTPDNGWKDRPKHVECYPQNKINFRNCCIFLDLLYKCIAMHGPMNVRSDPSSLPV